MQILDSYERFGAVTRFLHWSMAAAIVWQLASAASRFFFEDSAFEQFMWPTHKPLGFLILVFAVLRILWALLNWRNRPPRVNLAASLGHLALYGLFTGVAALGLWRQWASGRAFEVFGVTVFPGMESGKIDWILELGNNWHGELGWVLLAFIVGHILMAVWHKSVKSSLNVMPRMWRG